MKIISIKNIKNEIRQLVDFKEKNMSMPNEVLESWQSKFKLIREDETQKINGLRNPQIGAYFAVLSHWTHSKE